MMRPGCAVTTAALLSAAAGCSATRESQPSLARVEPSAAYNDQPLTLVIDASPAFRPAYRIDTASGSSTNEVGGFGVALEPASGPSGEQLVRVPASGVWWNGTELVAALPDHIAAGSYNVVVTDPRGARLEKPLGFLSLGTDTEAPTVSIDEPGVGAVIGANTDVTVSFSADDGLGHLSSLSWTVSRVGGASIIDEGACPPPDGLARASCVFSFHAPAPGYPGDRLAILAAVADDRGNVGSASLEVELAPRPTVTSLDPRSGPSVGGTLLTVEGSDFVPGATQIYVGETPLDTASADSTTISAVTVGWDPGLAAVTVRTGGAAADAGTFVFVAAPLVREVIPGRGAAAGGTPVAVLGNNFRNETEVAFVGVDGYPLPLRCKFVRGPSRIDGYAPAGSGTVAVATHDPVGGDGRLDQAFVYDDATPPGLAPDAGCPEAGTSP